MLIYYLLKNLGNYGIFGLKNTIVTENAILYHWSVLFLKASTLIKCIHSLTCSNHSPNFVYTGGILPNIVTHFSPGVQWLEQNIFLWILTFWLITSYNLVDGANDSEEHTAFSFRVDMGQAVNIWTAEGFVHIHYPSFNNVPHFVHEHGYRFSYQTTRCHKPDGIMNLRRL
jgi:hypothetical protein